MLPTHDRPQGVVQGDPQLTDKGANLQTEEGVTRIIASGGQVAATARYRHRLLCLDLKPWPASNGTAVVVACNGTAAAAACNGTAAAEACNGTAAATARRLQRHGSYGGMQRHGGYNGMQRHGGCSVMQRYARCNGKQRHD
ncbi:unnamed protein product [Closterium sp. Naga37s-1]|nr:unnamed protein product [Closterium sp. Naga37s-1]